MSATRTKFYLIDGGPRQHDRDHYCRARETHLVVRDGPVVATTPYAVRGVHQETFRGRLRLLVGGRVFDFPSAFRLRERVRRVAHDRRPYVVFRDVAEKRTDVAPRDVKQDARSADKNEYGPRALAVKTAVGYFEAGCLAAH